MNNSQLRVSSYDVRILIEAALIKADPDNLLSVGAKYDKLVNEIKAGTKDAYNISVSSLQRHYHQKVKNADRNGAEKESFQAQFLDGLSHYVHGERYENKYTVFFPDDNIYMDILKDLGITSATGKLTESKFNPEQCMTRINSSLEFIGIGGGKWVVNSKFEEFLKKIKRKRGKVRFLLLNPKCEEYSNLRDDRGQTMRTDDSVVLIKKYQNMYQDFFEVRFYDDLPTFRLVIIDKSVIGMSWYNFDAVNTDDKENINQFREHVGWKAPHLEIQASDIINNKYTWSLFSPLYEYFEREWGKAKKLDETIEC